MHHFFDVKVAGFRASTNDTHPPSFTTAPLGRLCSACFTSVVCRRCRDCCPCSAGVSDPLMLTKLLNDNTSTCYGSSIVELFNRSLALAVCRPSTSQPIHHTTVEESPLCPSGCHAISSDFKPSRYVAGISCRATRTTRHSPCTECLSSIRQRRMETAVRKELADILSAVDSGKLALMTLPDLSAAFDTVDDVTLRRRQAVSSAALCTMVRIISWRSLMT